MVAGAARAGRTTRLRTAAAAAAVLVALAGCGQSAPAPTPAAPAPALRDAAGERPLVGTAVAGGGHHVAAGYPDPFPNDERYRDLLAAQFSSLTPENQLKWEFVHPERETYDFAAADAIVDFAVAHGQAMRGHTLLWYSQTPDWLDAEQLGDDELRDLLHEHVTTVVSHFRGRVAAWDVANEILTAGGRLRTAQDPFLARFGLPIVADALRWAHEADPDAVLYLNDFDVEWGGEKLRAYVEIARELLDDGVPLGGFGIQGHLTLEAPFPDGFADALRAFADLGLDVAITELDVRMPLAGGGPTADQLERQADYYGRAVGACVAVQRCVGVTVWGVPDRYSWVPSFQRGQGAATPFDDDYAPKPAVAAMLAALAG